MALRNNKENLIGVQDCLDALDADLAALEAVVVIADDTSAELAAEDAVNGSSNSLNLVNSEDYSSALLTVNNGAQENSLVLTMDEDSVGKAVLTSQLSLANQTYSGAGTTSLIYRRANHVFSGTAPSGSVTVEAASLGSLTFIKNNTASTITLAANSTETFNGAATFDITTGQAVQINNFGALALICTVLG